VPASAQNRSRPPLSAPDCRTDCRTACYGRGVGQRTGIEIRHRTSCASRTGASCNCRTGYQASVWSARDGKRLRRTFPTLSAARAWRAEAQAALRRGTLQAPGSTTVREAAAALLDGMRSGHVRTRTGDVYKPSVLRGYQAALEQRIVPALGARRLGDVTRRDVQRLADEMLGQGLDPSTIRNALMPLRVIFRRALEDGEIAVNPCTALRLPAVRGRRERIASPTEAAALVAALPARYRPIYATALYAGLRRGELLALRWSDVDLASGVIHVERAYDDRADAVVEPKSHAGLRKVPIVGVLRDILVAHRADSPSNELVFASSTGRPVQTATIWRASRAAWARAGLEPIGLHEARHTFASILIAAGVNAKAITTFMGHASIQTTYDLYGKLMPGSETEATLLVDAYLDRAARLSTGRDTQEPTALF
jgi:integrase